jgi:hypothetical protein
MEIEEMPAGYLDELRELAASPDAQLSPLSRLVLVGAPAGRPIRATAGTLFREPDPAEVERIAAAVHAAAAAVQSPPEPPAVQRPGPGMRPAAGAPGDFASYMNDAEFPPVLPPPGAPAIPAGQPAFGNATPPAAPAPQPAQPAAPIPFAPAAATPAAPKAPAPPPQAPVPFGLPPPAGDDVPFGLPPPGGVPAFGIPDATPFGIPQPGKASPFGTPFALPEDPDPFGLTEDPEERAGYGWTWEPPEGHAAENPFDASDPFGTKG